MQLSINESLLDQAMQAGGVASQTQSFEVVDRSVIQTQSRVIGRFRRYLGRRTDFAGHKCRTGENYHPGSFRA